MRILVRVPHAHPRSGAALLMSMLVLFVLAALVFQISVSSATDARVARNDINLSTMDLACESALLQVYDKLKSDGDSAGAAAAPASGATQTPPAQTPGTTPNAAGGAGQPAQQAQPVDSRRDEWAMPQRTEINEIKLRIIVQDEDSKYNVLNMLNPDEKEAQAAFDRVVRILDLCREGTQADIDERTAQDMAHAMLDHMTKRKLSPFPRAKLLTDDEKTDDQGFPLSLREFMVLKPFDESYFKDSRDEDGKVVHSIESFLTVWSSLETVSELNTDRSAATAPAANANPTQNPNGAAPKGTTTPKPATTPAATSNTNATTIKSETNGYAVNINTAPPAVLKGLFDDREVPPRFWDEVIKYRNLEDDEKEGDSTSTDTQKPEDAPLDEYGRPILKRKIFDSISKLQEIDGWENILPAMQEKVNQLSATQSHVFSIYILARKATSQEAEGAEIPDSPEKVRAEEEKGDSLMRVVHSVVWRAKKGEDVIIIPILRWEILESIPHEVIDYPDENR